MKVYFDLILSYFPQIKVIFCPGSCNSGDSWMFSRDTDIHGLSSFETYPLENVESSDRHTQSNGQLTKSQQGDSSMQCLFRIFFK